MRRHAHAGAAGAVVVALGAWALSGAIGTAADKNEKGGYNAEVRKIADALKEGKEAEAKQEAAAIAKKAQGSLDDVMQSYKLRSKNGIGIGSTPDAIKPDGIEALLINARRFRATQLNKNPDAYAQMGYDSAAIAEITLQSPPEKDEGKKTKAAWNASANELLKASLDLTRAAKAKDAAAAKAAMMKMNNSCTHCHNVFRDK